VGGIHIPHFWNSPHPAWIKVPSSPPTVNVQAASPTPYALPSTSQTPPPAHLTLNTNLGISQITTLGFPRDRNSQATYAQLSLKRLLHFPVLQIANTPLAPAHASPSSESNRHYAHLNHIELGQLPEDLSKYSGLATEVRYSPPNKDRSLVASVKSDAIVAMRPYIIGPINTVFHDRFPSFRIECKSKNSSTVIANILY